MTPTFASNFRRIRALMRAASPEMRVMHRLSLRAGIVGVFIASANQVAAALDGRGQS